MRTVSFAVALILGCVLLIAAGKYKGSEDTTRNILIFSLGNDILTFINEDKLSGEDREAAYGIWVLLVSNPPLKTLAEMQADDKKAREQPSTANQELKKKIREKTQEILAGTQLANRPLTAPQAYDFLRLNLLEEIFEGASLRSEALDTLYEQVLESIRLTSEA